MKYYLALLLAVMLFTSCRQENANKGPSEEAEMISRLEERLGSMEEHISQLNEALEDSVGQQNTI